MTTSPFISVPELANALGGPPNARPAVFDASYLLHKPEFDGDYRSGALLERFEAGHIPGSRYVDVQTQFSDAGAATHYAHPQAQEIAAELSRLGVDRNTSVVVYDSTQGMFASRLWYLLSWVGVDARVLDGGYDAWVASGAAVETGPARGIFAVDEWTVAGERNAWISRDELASRASDDTRPLVCGLPASSFSGADTSRYSRRGHIPGSVNVSSRDLFDSDGTVRGADELRDAYASEGVTGDDEVLLYCGGGISAAANALTLATLGVTAVRIYDGSLEEWSADDSLPLETSV